MDIAPMRSCCQKENENELTGDKKAPILFFHNPFTSCGTVIIFCLFPLRDSAILSVGG